MSTSENFKEAREQRALANMSPEDRMLAMIAALQTEIKELRASVKASSDWQNNFSISAPAYGGGNQWVIDGGPESSSISEEIELPTSSYPWISQTLNGDGTYSAGMGYSESLSSLDVMAETGTFQLGYGTANTLFMGWADGLFSLSLADATHTVGLDPLQLQFWDQDDQYTSVGAGRAEFTSPGDMKTVIEVASVLVQDGGGKSAEFKPQYIKISDSASGQSATLDPDKLLFLPTGKITIGEDDFTPQEIDYFDTSGNGMTAKVLSTAPAGNSATILSLVQSEIRTALATGSITINCPANTGSFSFSY